MIKHFLSRYSLRYPRSLTYMLQASEYNIADYLTWFHRTKNFNKVENRKHLKKTSKAIFILSLLWIMVILDIFLVLYFFSLSILIGYFLSVATLIVLPYFLAYGIIFLLFLLKIIVQKPIEYFIIQRAKKTLSEHQAIKIAVAGSFGKTTMREILKVVLAEGKHVAAPPHSYNTPIGISSFIKTLKGDEEVLIFELGEYYPGDVRKLCNLVQPDIGVITGINEAHLHKFKRIDRTIKTIYELADCLGNKPIYVNGENKLAKENAHSEYILYSRIGAGDLKVEDTKTDLNGVSFTLIHNKLKLKLHSSLLGLHQVGPLVAAADIALHLGLQPEEIKVGVLKTKAFEHRFEPKTDATGVVLIDDSYNGNPDGVKAVINFLSSLKDNRRFYVTPGLVEMGDRTEEIHKNIGKWLAEAEIEKVVLVKNSVTKYIEAGLQGANYRGTILWFDDALQAFSALPHLTVKGDVVLLQNDWPDQYA